MGTWELLADRNEGTERASAATESKLSYGDKSERRVNRSRGLGRGREGLPPG